MSQDIREMSAQYKDTRGGLIPLLQEIQNTHGYLSRESILTLSREIKISESEIFGVASFYTQFKFRKPGLHQIKVCLGTACHVRGGETLMENVERELGIHYGETTADGNVSLERVACVGCCALAPVMVIDQNVHGKMAQKKLVKALGALGGGHHGN